MKKIGWNFIQFKYLFLVVACLVFSMTSRAQRPVLKASIDSTSLMIGEQSLVHLDVSINKGQKVQMPFIADTLMRGVEVLEIPKPDTVDLGNNRIRIRQDYLITSFDSALYLLPPFQVISGMDTIYSNSLGLKVSTYPNVDTESKKFFDIKNVIDPEFVWTDYLNYILWGLGVLAAGFVIWYIVKRLKEKKSLIPFKKEEPVFLPHEIALRELDEVKAKKMWQQGRIKEYHSRITDTLRQYIERRFAIDAMEMTSGEILDRIRRIDQADSVYENLKQILGLADFVKFAKYHALPDENELSLMNAYLFVNQTKIEEKIKVSEPVEEETGSVESPTKRQEI